jgi:hypothetical protein
LLQSSFIVFENFEESVARAIALHLTKVGCSRAGGAYRLAKSQSVVLTGFGAVKIGASARVSLAILA